MIQAPVSAPATKRLVWIDLAKGLGILWVVYFHLFTNYIETDAYAKTPAPTGGHFISAIAGDHGWDSLISSLETLWKIVWLGGSQVGFHAVGLFIFLGGWSLAATTWKKADHQPIVWRSWYFARFVRLYPMYWTAHLLLLITPFTWLEPIDWRFLLSLTGMRWIHAETAFFYGNAAWWYFAMLIQLYAVFPLLFILMRRMGLWYFLGIVITAGLGMRYLLLVHWASNGIWSAGANCMARFPEFALGMVLGILHLKNRAQVERVLLGWPSMVVGLVMYTFVSPLYAATLPYVFADLYTAIACSLVVIGLSGLLQNSAFWSKWLSLVGTFSFGLYLTHQPLVTWLGQLIKNLPVSMFLLISAGTLVILSTASIWLERRVNSLTERVLAHWKGGPTPKLKTPAPF